VSYRLLTETDVAALVDLGAAIEALEAVLGEQGAGQAFPVPKALATWDPRSSMHSLGSAAPAAGYAGFKSWVNTPAGASAVYALWHASSGRLAAVMEGAGLGALRTAGISGVATRWLADPAADELAICGTGRQALGQVAAVAAVRPIGHVRVWSPDRDHREAFCGRVSERTGLRATAYDSAADALDGVPVVTLITRATEPFVDAGMLAAGTHVNAVGAILPGAAELGGDVLGAAEIIVADDVGNARKASRELLDHFGDDDAAWKAVVRLADIVAAGEGRPAGARLTVFKGMGSGLSDLAVAQVALQRAEEQDRGLVLDQPAMPEIRF
jgi:ornithine cyclodeaminase